MITYNEILDRINTSKEMCFDVKMTEEMADRLASEGVELHKKNGNIFTIYTTKRTIECIEELNLDNIKNQYNLWVSPSGKIYKINYCGHFNAALALGSYSDTRHEKKGWLHISDGLIQNYYKVKMSEKQYDAVYLWAEVNNRLDHLNTFIRENEQK